MNEIDESDGGDAWIQFTDPRNGHSLEITQRTDGVEFRGSDRGGWNGGGVTMSDEEITRLIVWLQARLSKR